MENNLINLVLPFRTGDRWGFPCRCSTVRTSWETDSIYDDSDKVPELSPVIFVKIYLHFAANSFWRRRRGTLSSCVETKREKKLSSLCKAKNYWKSHVQAHALMFFAFYKWAWSTDKQGKWTIIYFRCNKKIMPYVEVDQIVNPRQPPLPLSLQLRAIELASGWGSDLSPSTQGMIFCYLLTINLLW